MSGLIIQQAPLVIFTAAILYTSQAYLADNTSGNDRTKGFESIGTTFGRGCEKCESLDPTQ